MNQRMRDIADAATRLFLQQGYAKTQMAHIARAVGVSVGTMYLDFAGKREILHYILKCTVDPSFAERTLERPVTDELFDGLEDELVACFEREERAFAAHLDDVTYGLEELAGDAFDLLSRYAVGCLFIEKNQFSFEELAQRYVTYRRSFLDTMVRYLRVFAERGTVRPLEHPELTAVLMVELLSWWAMDVRYTAFETLDVSPELARQLCIDNLVAAYGQRG